MKTIRYFKKTSKFTKGGTVLSEINHWKWVKGKGLFVKFEYWDDYVKSEYYLKELLGKDEPDGQIKEITKDEIKLWSIA